MPPHLAGFVSAGAGGCSDSQTAGHTFKVLEAARAPGVKEVALDAEVIEALCATEVEEWQPEAELRVLALCKEGLATQARRAIELRYEQAHRPPEIAQRMG